MGTLYILNTIEPLTVYPKRLELLVNKDLGVIILGRQNVTLRKLLMAFRIKFDL